MRREQIFEEEEEEEEKVEYYRLPRPCRLQQRSTAASRSLLLSHLYTVVHVCTHKCMRQWAHFALVFLFLHVDKPDDTVENPSR